MARIRSMKPEMRTSLVVASWPREVRLFWAYLWGYLDDHGRGVDDPRLVKADCFPLDEDLTATDMEAWLTLVNDAGPLCRYEVAGRRYIHSVNWTEHQRPQHPGKSRLPPCPHGHDSGDPPERFTRLSGDPLPGANGHPMTPSRGTVYAGRASAALTENTQAIPLMKPSGDPQETLTPEQGAGSREQGEVEVPAAAALALVPTQPPTPPTLAPLPPGATTGQRAKAITDAYAAIEPMSRWPAVNAIVKRAIETQRWTDQQIHHALQRLAAAGRSVTIDALRIELVGPPTPTDNLIERDGIRLRPETARRIDDDQRWATLDAQRDQLAIGGAA